MNLLDAARLLSIASWAVVACLRVPNIWRVLRGRSRFYDVLWSIVGCFAFNTVGFNVAWFIGGDPTFFRLVLYSFTIGLALASLSVMQKYERAQDAR